ncbi:MAG: FeoC-like transcriptional regulator [Propionibacteriaceae bacterium]|nr:FeoC-like transcriptional regulator [Propionibacteriaceae bacterium]
MSGPLSAVLGAFADGAHSLADVSARTGLPSDVVQASVDHLVRLGRLEARELAMGCPSSGCGSCASASADGGPGCGASGPDAGRRGPVLVALTLRR